MPEMKKAPLPPVLEWVKSTPLGLPVVPEVYNRVEPSPADTTTETGSSPESASRGASGVAPERSPKETRVALAGSFIVGASRLAEESLSVTITRGSAWPRT